MHLPNETETRAFFQDLGCDLDPIDPSRGKRAVRLRLSVLGEGVHVYAPNLSAFWRDQIEVSLYHERQNEWIGAVVQCWKDGDPATRAAIEEWIAKEGYSPWNRSFKRLTKALPSAGYTREDLPEDWKERLAQHFQNAIADRRHFFEKVADGIKYARVAGR